MLMRIPSNRTPWQPREPKHNAATYLLAAAIIIAVGAAAMVVISGLPIQ